MNGGGAEREGDTESETGSRLWAISPESDSGLELPDREIVTWAEIGRATNWATQVPPNSVFLYLWFGTSLSVWFSSKWNVLLLPQVSIGSWGQGLWSTTTEWYVLFTDVTSLVPGTVLVTLLHALILTTKRHYSHSTDEETEVQSNATCLGDRKSVV